jgi:hypothetical protein
MIPPLMSSTLNAQDVLGGGNKTNDSKTQTKTGTSTQTTTKVKTEEKSAGRPEKSDDQKSAKTIANKESMS